MNEQVPKSIPGPQKEQTHASAIVCCSWSITAREVHTATIQQANVKQACEVTQDEA